MAEYKYLSELLHTGVGTEGQLLIPRKILPTLIDESQKNLIPRELAAMYIGPAQIPGASIDINRVVEYKQKVRLVAEGAEVPLDQTEYNNLNVKPLKYGVAIRITREMLEEDPCVAKFEKQIKFMRFNIQEGDSDRQLRGVKTYVFYGPTDMGKTYTAMNLMDPANVS